MLRAALSMLLAATCAACSAGPTDVAVVAPGTDGAHVAGTLLDAAQAKAGEAAPAQLGDQRPAFCARPGDDAVRDLFCGDAPPAITNLGQLQELLGIDLYRDINSGYNDPPMDGGLTEKVPGKLLVPRDGGVLLNLNASLLGHSTALSGHMVSPINPRAVVIGEHTLLAFHRGVQRVEIASRARDHDATNFYLLSFSQACNAAAAGCRPGDLYTPRIESDWQSVLLQDDEELKNTAVDCRQCHQRARAVPIVLMREMDGPWTHFFGHDLDGAPEVAYPEPLGRDFVRDYRHAKGDESYAAIPISVLRGTIGMALELHIEYGQPLVFKGATIVNERWPRGPDGFLPGGPRRSATWDAMYEGFKRGQNLAPPYVAARATDPAKQAALSAAYQAYQAGLLDAAALPDLADIYPDDPQTRAEIGLQTEPSATPVDALIQACGSCHNDVLDQTISRARFSIDLSRMDRAERELAVTRIQAAASSTLVMPPPETRQLTAEARDALVTYLRRDTRSAEDDARLASAAQLGMAVSNYANEPI